MSHVKLFSVCVCVLTVWNKVLMQRISNCEFKLWMIHWGKSTENEATTYLASKWQYPGWTCVLDYSLTRRQNSQLKAIEN